MTTTTALEITDLREGAWSSMKSGLGNLSAATLDRLAAATLDRLASAVRGRLARIQRQPALIAGFPGQAGLTPGSRPQ